MENIPLGIPTRLANRDNGPNAIKILDDEIITTLRNTIMAHWQMPDNYDLGDKENVFPAPQPISLERRDLYKLIKYEYVVCAKSDGMRFLLICYGGSNYMVDRAFKFNKVELNFDIVKLYGSETPEKNKLGGIFDGELVLNKQAKWQFVLHDCIDIHGKDISDAIFPARYQEVIKLVCDYWKMEGSEFRLASKQFFPFKQLGLLHRLIEEDKLDHAVDGIICTPRNKRIGSLTQNDLFKWKPRNKLTIDFKIVKHPEGGITAYVNKKGLLVDYAHARHNSPEEKKFLEELAKNCPDFINKSVVECEYDDVNESYIPIKVRADKILGNSEFTVRKTMVNIRENITIEELIELANPPED